MQQAEKFDFNTVFDEGQSQAAAPSRPKMRFNASEVEEIRSQAYAEGQASVEAQAAETCAQALSATAASLNALFERLSTTEHTLRTHAFDLALLTARKMAQHALKTYPEQEIEALVQECLTKLAHEPRLTITVADHLKQAVEPRLIQLAQDQSFSGKININGSDTITDAQCTIEWSEGGIEQNPEDTGAAIEEIVQSRLAVEDPTSEQGDLFSREDTGTQSIDEIQQETP